MTAPAATDAAAPAASRRTVPLWSLVTAAAGGVLVAQAARPLDDPDVWWHVRSGDEILSTARLPSREHWVYTATGRRWVPTSWLSDVVMALAHRLDGWQGVRVLTVLVAVAFAWLLARLVQRAAAPVGAAATYALVVTVTAGYLRERPQAASLCLVVVLAAWLERTRSGAPPPVWRVVVLAWLWASLHGMWVLLPLTLLLAGVTGGVTALRRVAPAAGLAVLAAAATPVGPRLVAQPFVVAHRARDIAEWAPVHLLSWQAGLLVALAALLLASGPRSERLFAAALLLFACLAVRNVAPVVVLLAPVVARRLSVLLPSSTSTARVAAPAAVLGLAAGATALLLSASPAVSTRVPTRLVATLDQQPGSHVLVDYDVGGLVTGRARHVSAAVDGRTDVYDPQWLHSYLQLTELRGAWQHVLDELRPDRALLDGRSGLARELQRQGWTVDERQGPWALMSAP